MEFKCNEFILGSTAEIIKNKFYFGIFIELPNESNELNVLNTDNMFTYLSYYKDFGPFNIAQVIKYSDLIENILQKNETSKIKLLHCTTLKNKINILNSAFLVGSFQILKLHKTDKEAFNNLLKYSSMFISYIDASTTPFSYLLTLENCLSGIYKAYQKKLYRIELFDLAEYEHFDKIENGDLNWVIYQRILAFSGPEDELNSKDSLTHSPEVYIPFFRRNNVLCVIRLNEKKYSSEIFRRAGIDHFDLYFDDGDVPPGDIINAFLTICNSYHQAIAIHCAAGLGRTGTLIAYYLMYFHGFSAAESIAWIRICRPGSILGKQQFWLIEKENELTKLNFKKNRPTKYKEECRNKLNNRLLYLYNVKFSSLSSSSRFMVKR